MDPISLEPRYSTAEIPGKCIECLVEQKLNSCLRQLLADKTEDKKLQEIYNALLYFLNSPESKKLRDESEKYLADGKEVKIKIHYKSGKFHYELKIEEPNLKEEIK